ncbi:hypothetical protein PUR_04860 [Paenibacillus sp. URB8-2]|nr:hypothetical protein PUR_04860 [Paenibacillus sp. URB8-2]
MWIGENETSKFWLSVLNDLRSRGVQDILIIYADNLNGFSEAISSCYPKTEIQKCIIHQIRNSTRYVSYKDLKKSHRRSEADPQSRNIGRGTAQSGPLRGSLGNQVSAHLSGFGEITGENSNIRYM